jgi:hypothetical protein
MCKNRHVWVLEEANARYQHSQIKLYGGKSFVALYVHLDCSFHER